jgi:hypothetical protein
MQSLHAARPRKQSAWLDAGSESDLEQEKSKELTFRHNRVDG